MILAVVLCCLILACVTFEYMRLMIVAQGVRDSVQSAIVDVATENWDEAYAGLREGYSGGYQLAGSSWSQNVTSGNVYARLQDVLGIEYEGGQYVKYSGENLEYRLYDLHLDVENAPLAPSVPDGIKAHRIAAWANPKWNFPAPLAAPATASASFCRSCWRR